MVLQREAIALEDFERQERGLPMRKRKIIERPEPIPPVVDGLLKLEDIPTLEIKDFSARGRTVRNEDGMGFTGFDVYIQFQDKSEFQGFMLEGPFQELKARIPKDRTDLLSKIA